MPDPTATAARPYRWRDALRWHVGYRLGKAFFWLSDQGRRCESAGRRLMQWAG